MNTGRRGRLSRGSRRARRGPSGRPPPQARRPEADAVALSRAGARLGLAACAAVIGCAFALSYRKLSDFDTWWHLASGRWIASHHTVPATDTLSHTVLDHAWVNLQWGFDLGLYACQRLGGAPLICFIGALAVTAAVALLLRMVVRYLGLGLGALFVLIVILMAQERFLLRPELLSFLLFAGVLFILDHEKGKSGRDLFWLVPLMILWVNVHALFVLGVFAIMCALIGAGTTPSRRLVVWGGAALASVVINPYGLKGVFFPLKLVSRINGSSPVFQTVGEFASPFAPGATDLTAVLFKILLGVGVIAALAALFVNLRQSPGAARARREGFDWGGLVLFGGLSVVSIAARRNIALFAIGATPFMAQCLATVLGSSSVGRRRLVGGAPVAATGAMVAAALIAVSAVTGAFYKWEREPQEFGGGVIDGYFPTRAAAFARAAALPPTLYNDMLGGGFLTWDDPVGGGVFIDGRLEVYDTPFLTEYVAAVGDPTRWQADADRYGVQTVILCHRYEAYRVLVGRLARDRVWSLVYADEVAAVFVRTAGNAAALARAAALRPEWDARTEAWLSAPAKRWPYPAGRIEGTRAYARFLATVGAAEPAVRAYLKLLELGIVADDEVQVRLLLARHFAKTGRTAEAQDQARRILAINPDQAEAQALLR